MRVKALFYWQRSALVTKPSFSLMPNFETLARDVRPLLMRIALKRLRNPDRAEDAVQDTILKAWRAFESYSGDQSFTGWCVAILRNTITDHIRKFQREVSLDSFDDSEFLASGDYELPTLRNAAEIEAIDGLASADMVIVETWLQHDSDVDRAAALGMTLAAYKKRLYTVRLALRAQLYLG